MKSKIFLMLMLFAFISILSAVDAKPKYTKFIKHNEGSYHGAKRSYTLANGHTVNAPSYGWVTTTTSDFTAGTSTTTTVVEGVLNGTSGTFTSTDGGPWVWKPGGKLPRECEENEEILTDDNGFEYYIYPNPATNKIRIVGELSEDAQINCFSISGADHSGEIINSNSDIDVSLLTSGDYLLVVNNAGRINTIKFTVIK